MKLVRAVNSRHVGSCAIVCTDSAAEQVAFYLGASRASATHRAYAADLAAFRAWGGTVPTTPEVVAAYLATHATLAASTLRRRLAAIADAHQSGGYPDPTKHVLVRKVLRGICRTHGVTRSAAAPLDIATLARVVGTLSRDLLGLRDRALLLVGFFAALRRAELVGLEVSDVALGGGAWTVTIRRSKTDQYGVGQVVALPLLESPLCPVTALQGWLLAAGITGGPVFRTIDCEGLRQARPPTVAGSWTHPAAASHRGRRCPDRSVRTFAQVRVCRQRRAGRGRAAPHSGRHAPFDLGRARTLCPRRRSSDDAAD